MLKQTLLYTILFIYSLFRLSHFPIFYYFQRAILLQSLPWMSMPTWAEPVDVAVEVIINQLYPAGAVGSARPELYPGGQRCVGLA